LKSESAIKKLTQISSSLVLRTYLNILPNIDFHAQQFIYDIVRELLKSISIHKDVILNS